MCRKRIAIYVNIIVIFIFVFVPYTLHAAVPYSLKADDINYDYQTKKIYAEKEVIFTSEDIEINADKLIIVIDKNMVIAEGEEIKLISAQQEIRGSHLEYDYENKSGKFYGASSEIENLKFKGQVIEITVEKDYQYKIEGASFTPCILEEPHYQLKADNIKIYPGDRVIGKNISFWWGKTKLLRLPYYILKYNDGDNAKGLKGSVPIPKIGYDSQQGIIMELDYPYLINNDSDGNIYINIIQKGEKDVKIENTYKLRKNLTLKSLYNYDKVIEDDDEVIINEIFSTSFVYKLNKNFTISNQYRYKEKIEAESTEIDKLIAVALNYNKNNLGINTLAGYNYERQKRQQEFKVDYVINPNNKINLYGRFFDETPERYSCNYSGSIPLEWEAIYREGYDTDYSPYLKFKLPEFKGIESMLQVGKITTENTTVNKAQIDLAYSKLFEPVENLLFGCKEDYIINFYYGENKRFQALTSELNGQYSYRINEKVNLSTKLSWLKTITEGNYLLNDDKIEKEETIESLLSLELITSQPDSALIINNNNIYNVKNEEWDNIKVALIRKFDCYSLKLDYDFVDKTIEFNVNL